MEPKVPHQHFLPVVWLELSGQLLMHFICVFSRDIGSLSWN